MVSSHNTHLFFSSNTSKTTNQQNEHTIRETQQTTTAQRHINITTWTPQLRKLVTQPILASPSSQQQQQQPPKHTLHTHYTTQISRSLVLSALFSGSLVSIYMVPTLCPVTTTPPPTTTHHSLSLSLLLLVSFLLTITYIYYIIISSSQRNTRIL